MIRYFHIVSGLPEDRKQV